MTLLLCFEMPCPWLAPIPSAPRVGTCVALAADFACVGLAQVRVSGRSFVQENRVRQDKSGLRPVLSPCLHILFLECLGGAENSLANALFCLSHFGGCKNG